MSTHIKVEGASSSRLLIINNEISFYIKIFILYVDLMLDESYTLSRISIPTYNGFH